MCACRLTVVGGFLALVCFSAVNAGDGRLPKDAVKCFGTDRFRSGDGILSFACSPDGKYLASGNSNDVVRHVGRERPAGTNFQGAMGVGAGVFARQQVPGDRGPIRTCGCGMSKRVPKSTWES